MGKACPWWCAEATRAPADRPTRRRGAVAGRLNRILEIDEVNLLARVQPDVVTGDQDAVER
jgi:hypothetical protein